MNNHSDLLDFRVIADTRGKLVALEGDKEIPFSIARIFYIYTCAASRGFHAHIQTHQVIICVSGACTIFLDDGKQRWQYRLQQPHQGLVIKSMVWCEMHDFTPDCVLLVLADTPYDESDYLRDYDEFLQLAAQKNER